MLGGALINEGVERLEGAFLKGADQENSGTKAVPSVAVKLGSTTPTLQTLRIIPFSVIPPSPCPGSTRACHEPTTLPRESLLLLTPGFEGTLSTLYQHGHKIKSL